jgi:hypothetical protein
MALDNNFIIPQELFTMVSKQGGGPTFVVELAGRDAAAGPPSVERDYRANESSVRCIADRFDAVSPGATRFSS